jgi:hypothetical protein
MSNEETGEPIGGKTMGIDNRELIRQINTLCTMATSGRLSEEEINTIQGVVFTLERLLGGDEQ